MIVDMRLRPPIKSWKNARMFASESFAYLAIAGFPRSPSAVNGSLPTLIAEMDEAGIAIGVVMGRQSPPPFGSVPNDELVELTRDYPTRFVAWAGIDTDCSVDTSLAELERCRRLDVFRGISIEPTLSDRLDHAGDHRLYPIFEACQKWRLPINISLSSPLQTGAGQLIDKGRPQYLVKAARDFPQLDFHVGHAAWPWAMEMIAVAISCPNIWVSPDMYLIPQFPGSAEFAKAAINFLPRRTLFGTAYPFKPLRETVAAYRSWKFPAEIESNVLGANARRLMGLA